MFRKAENPQLAEALRDFATEHSTPGVLTTPLPITEHYVLDGCSLLIRLPWTRETTYGQIADQYTDFVISWYGQATVVFDGYNDSSNVKANEHRTRQKTSPLVHCDSNIVFSNDKAEAILSHGSNKQ